MRIAESNWQHVEDWLRHDDRAVLPVGSTEQHAGLSLCTDNILAERVAVEAAEPLGVPVFPVLSYGITPSFMAYPGTITLRIATFLAVIRDVLDGLKRQGFRRVLIVNGHGGNSPAQAFAQEWVGENPGMQVRFHNWWNAPRTIAEVQRIDRIASHASWMENFPWTRLPNLALPQERKPMTDLDRVRTLGPDALRDTLGDGNFGGLYQRPDEEMLSIWRIGVAETRELLESGW
jgi:creatinine amidohydrolase